MNTRGFTFLETLLAVTLFSIVTASSYGIFTMGISIWRRTQNVDVHERKALLALEKISHDIRSTIRSTDKNLEIGGGHRGFTLPSVVSVEEESGPAVQYGAITYEWDASEKVICKRVTSATDLYRNQIQSNACREVAGRIRNAKFRYWLYDGIGESYSWYDTWDHKDGLPAAVSLSLEIEPAVQGQVAVRQKTLERTVLIPVGGKGTEKKPGGDEDVKAAAA